MVSCPRCHFQNPVKQRACQACGGELPYASAPSHERPGQSRPTLRGLRSPDPLPPIEPGASASRTDLTLPSLVSPTPEQIRSHRITATLLGHAHPDAQQPPVSQPHFASSPPSPIYEVTAPPPSSAVYPAPSSHNRGEESRAPLSTRATLVGHAPAPSDAAEWSNTAQTMPSMRAVSPDEAWTHERRDVVEVIAPTVNLNTSQVDSVPPSSSRNSSARTYLAVAPPSLDIPLSSVPSSSRNTPTSPDTSAPVSLTIDTVFETNSRANPNQAPTDSTGTAAATPFINAAHTELIGSAAQSRIAKGVLAITSLLGVGLLLFTWAWNPPAPVLGKINSEASPPALELWCDSCANGSYVVHQGQRHEFTDHHATLPLSTVPQVGSNTFELDVHRSGVRRDEQVTLAVPVDYRAKWNLSELTAVPPRLAIAVEAAPGVSMRINDAHVALSNGHGTHSLPLQRKLASASANIDWLEETAIITTSGGQSPSSVEYRVRVPVVPLVIDTPHSDFYTDTKLVVVSGRTSPHANVTTETESVNADATGYFEVTLIPQLGLNNVEVTATLDGHAPRTTPVVFTHSDNLTKLAVAYQARALRRFDEVIQRLSETKTPLNVALAGRVQEWRTDGNRTRALVAISSGCPQRTCLVRLEHPARTAFTTNQLISVFGVVTSPSKDFGPFPTIQSHFILQ